MISPAQARELYAAIPTDRLTQLRAAFAQDRESAMRPQAVEFCDGRIAIIDDELKWRHEWENRPK